MSMSTPDLNWKNNVYLQHYIGMETSETKMNAALLYFSSFKSTSTHKYSKESKYATSRSAGFADIWFGIGYKIFQDTRMFHGFTWIFDCFPTSSSSQHSYQDTHFFLEDKNRAIRGLAVVHNSQKSEDEVSSLYSNYHQSLVRCPNDVTYSIIVTLWHQAQETDLLWQHFENSWENFAQFIRFVCY